MTQWFKLEDNGDGTTTMTVRVDPLGEEEQTVIFEMDFEEMFSAFIPENFEEMMEEMLPKLTIIPNEGSDA